MAQRRSPSNRAHSRARKEAFRVTPKRMVFVEDPAEKAASNKRVIFAVATAALIALTGVAVCFADSKSKI